MLPGGLTSTALGLAALLASPVTAYWRMPCPGRVLTERIDPIVNPGAIASHVHTVSGGNGFNFTMDYADARASECSSCPIKQDLSNYWTPKLYYHAKNGSFIDVPQVGDYNGIYGSDTFGGMNVYYLQRPGPNNDALKAFPKGFRMLAGDPLLRRSTGTFASQAVGFVCLDYSGTSSQYNHLPNVNCPDGVRAQIFFPSCWDGVNLDSADHKSHMSYPNDTAYDNGRCPASHPVHMVSLFYEVIYQTDNFANEWYGTGQPFVFSMGDPTGYGFHGDFVNGWDVPVLQKAIDGCTGDTGLIEDCQYFDFFTNEQCQACVIPPQVDEAVTGVLKKLPGCNPVTKGPARAVAVDNCADPAIGSYETYFTDVTKTLKYEYVGCGNDSTSALSLTGASYTSSEMTVESCVSYCKSSGYKYAGLESSWTQSECYCGNSIAASRAPQTGVLGNCFTACPGNSKQICGGFEAISLYKSCGSGACSNALYLEPSGTATVATSKKKTSSTAKESTTTTKKSSTTSMKTSTTTNKSSTTTKKSSTTANKSSSTMTKPTTTTSKSASSTTKATSSLAKSAPSTSAHSSTTLRVSSSTTHPGASASSSKVSSAASSFSASSHSSSSSLSSSLATSSSSSPSSSASTTAASKAKAAKRHEHGRLH